MHLSKSMCSNHYFQAFFILLFLSLITRSVPREDNKHAYRSTEHSDEIGPSAKQNSGGKNSADDGQFCSAKDSAERDGCRGVLDEETGTPTESKEGGRADSEDEITRSSMAKDGWDRSGYVTFCPCMGNFGNQVEQYLGSIAFAKALNRTLLLPPFHHISYNNRKVHQTVPFTELFQVSPLLEFHRAVPLQDFLERLASKYWPPGQRKGFAYEFKGMPCSMKQGGGQFWDEMSPPVKFDECVSHKLMTSVDTEDEASVVAARNAWNERFPSRDHPVLVLSQAAGKFPMLPGNRKIQKYIRWTDEFFAEAKAYIAETFGNDSWVAVHLRNRGDWVKACEKDIETRAYVMASPQCHDIRIGAVTQDMCLPSVSHILELTLKVFQDVKAKHLFIATDKHPYLEDFQKLLQPLGVSVHHLNPSTPQVDLMILGQADYFIGSCTSSFTSFVKRERDANGRPSIFWGQEYKGFQ